MVAAEFSVVWAAMEVTHSNISKIQLTLGKCLLKINSVAAMEEAGAFSVEVEWEEVEWEEVAFSVEAEWAVVDSAVVEWVEEVSVVAELDNTKCLASQIFQTQQVKAQQQFNIY